MRPLADLMPHAAPAHRTAAHRLVRGLLGVEAGSTLSVQDGEAWTVHRSQDVGEILAALCTTGLDNLRWRAADGRVLGTLLLIWCNGADELVADYSAPTDFELDALTALLDVITGGAR